MLVEALLGNFRDVRLAVRVDRCREGLLQVGEAVGLACPQSTQGTDRGLVLEAHA